MSLRTQGIEGCVGVVLKSSATILLSSSVLKSVLLVDPRINLSKVLAQACPPPALPRISMLGRSATVHDKRQKQKN